jgi:hypothetical protein
MYEWASEIEGSSLMKYILKTNKNGGGGLKKHPGP